MKQSERISSLITFDNYTVEYYKKYIDKINSLLYLFMSRAPFNFYHAVLHSVKGQELMNKSVLISLKGLVLLVFTGSFIELVK